MEKDEVFPALFFISKRNGPLILQCIGNRKRRNEKIRECAQKNHTMVRRLQKLYYRELAGRSLVEERVLARNTIARNGLSDYQRNKRPLFGSVSEWKNRIGAYQMDATQADLYLVSRLDRKAVIGKLNIYLAVDTVVVKRFCNTCS